MVFINETGTIGLVIIGLNNITGSLFLTLFAILIILMVLCLALRLPLEAISIILLPLLLTFGAYTSEFMAVLGIALIYGGVLVGKYILMNR